QHHVMETTLGNFQPAICSQQQAMRFGTTEPPAEDNIESAAPAQRIREFLCPSGCRGTFDLSADAFADIADPNAGKVNIHYQ
ncbi:hypothetical protein KI387_009216, partial [Taxus chinensis]